MQSICNFTYEVCKQNRMRDNLLEAALLRFFSVFKDYVFALCSLVQAHGRGYGGARESFASPNLG